jgi:hypothetical protein
MTEEGDDMAWFKDHEHCADVGKCWMSETQIEREGPCPALAALEREIANEEAYNAHEIEKWNLRGISAPDF